MVSADGTSEQLNAEQGMPIGVAPDVPFSIFERPLKKGDIFALYSDGVSEARNRKKEEYGIETLQKKLQQLKASPTKEILDKTIVDLNRFMGKADQHDDITLLIVKIE
jgi:sigma-B regulation protein RsbU (phosphoserine phosphatase)